MPGVSHRQPQEAPAPLELVREFINAWDREIGEDAFETASGVADWLIRRGLAEGRTVVTEPQRRRTVELREALRALAVGHAAGERPDPDALRRLGAAATRARVELSFGPDESPRLEPADREAETDTGVDTALGRVAALVGLAMFDGTWGRLKACVNPECGWSFYDRSKNHSRAWCQMAECGNRAKAQAFRARRAQSGPA